MFPTLINALRETVFMVLCASAITVLVGIPLGILTATLANSHNKLVKGIYYMLFTAMQCAKITPYLLLMVLFIPLSNWFIDHKVSYSVATIIPLSTAGVLLLANKIFLQLDALSKKWHSTAKSMGATTQQAMWLILLPESYPDIIRNSATICSFMVGFSAIAGALGAGGLGQLAIEKSINDPNPPFVILSVLILIAMQQLIQLSGTIAVQHKQ